MRGWRHQPGLQDSDDSSVGYDSDATAPELEEAPAAASIARHRPVVRLKQTALLMKKVMNSGDSPRVNREVPAREEKKRKFAKTTPATPAAPVAFGDPARVDIAAIDFNPFYLSDDDDEGESTQGGQCLASTSLQLVSPLPSPAPVAAAFHQSPRPSPVTAAVFAAADDSGVILLLSPVVTAEFAAAGTQLAEPS